MKLALSLVGWLATSQALQPVQTFLVMVDCIWANHYFFAVVYFWLRLKARRSLAENIWLRPTVCVGSNLFA